MQIESTDASGAHSARVAFNRALDAGQPGAALALYLTRYPVFSARSVTEWRLGAALLDAAQPAGLEYPGEWPADLWARASGGALAFTLAQLLGREIAPPPLFQRPPPVPSGQRRRLALAWGLRPDSVCLAEPGLRRAFASWAAADADAIGPLLLAAGRLGDRELSAALGARWLQEGCCGGPAGLEDLLAALNCEGLVSIGFAALPRGLLAHADDPGALLRLLEVAFVAAESRFDGGPGGPREAIGQVFAWSTRLLWDAADADLKARALVLRLGARGALGHFEDAAARELGTDYLDLWRPTGRPFPHPEWLAAPLQRIGADEAAAQLLERADTGSAPAWVQLAQREVRAEGHPAVLLDAWRQLHSADPDDPLALIGLSRRACEAGDRDLREQLLGVWRRLLPQPGYQRVAAAFIVLLQSGPRDLIEAFRTHLLGQPLDNGYAASAARAYLRALRGLWLWPELLEFLRSEPARAVSGLVRFTEYAFSENLAQVDTLPADSQGCAGWFACWDRLLALPLEGAMLAETLRRFLSADRGLRERGPAGQAVRTLPYFTDLSLQLLRRAQAEAERRLATPADTAPHPQAALWLGQLRAGASLARTLEILDQLSPTH